MWEPNGLFPAVELARLSASDKSWANKNLCWTLIGDETGANLLCAPDEPDVGGKLLAAGKELRERLLGWMEIAAT